MIDLRQGDCLELMKDIPDKSIDCILTDPPYLYLKNQKLDRPFDEEKYFNEVNRILKDDGFIVLFGRGSSFYRWNTILDSLGFEFKEEIIWNKKYTSTIFNPIMRVHETVSLYSKNGKLNIIRVPYVEMKQNDINSIITDIKRIKSALNNTKSLDAILLYLKSGEINITKDKKYKHNLSGIGINRDRAVETFNVIEKGLKEKSIIEVNSEHFKSLHPTQKPVRLLERILNIVSNENDVVLDTFMGSGSTGVACLNINRNFIGFEIDEEYFGIAKERIEEAQNKKVVEDE